jgi:hypothetical protein
MAGLRHIQLDRSAPKYELNQNQRESEMKYSNGHLTDKQVKETFFKIPDFVVVFAFGLPFLNEINSEREEVRAKGGELDVIGWPDGTTGTWARHNAKEDIDLDDLLLLYRKIAEAQADIDLDGGNHAS